MTKQNYASDEEGYRLITAFLQIADPDVRKSIIEAAEAAQLASPRVLHLQSGKPDHITQDN